MIKGLEEFGKVEKCEEVNGEFHILITDGFNDGGRNTFELMKLIDKAIGKKYKFIKRCVTENDKFDYILKT